MSTYWDGVQAGRAEMLKAVVAELRRQRGREVNPVRLAQEIELKFGAGEADTRSPDNGSQDADQVVTDAPAPALSGVCEWETVGPPFKRKTSCYGSTWQSLFKNCPDCGRPVKLKEDK